MSIERIEKKELMGRTSSSVGISQPRFETVEAFRTDAKVTIWKSKGGRYCYEITDVAGEVRYLAEGFIEQGNSLKFWIDEKLAELKEPEGSD